MKNHKVLFWIILATVLLAGTLSVTTPVKKGESAEKKSSYSLPIAANGNVQILDYSDYDIENISAAYNTQLQTEISQQLAEVKASSEATFDDLLLVSNPYLTNNNSLYINFETTKEIASVSYRVTTEGVSDFSETLVNSGTSTDFESQIIGLIAGEKNSVTLTITYSDQSTDQTTFDYTPKASNSGLGTQLDVTTYDKTTKLADGLYALIGDSTLENRVIALVDNDVMSAMKFLW